MVAAVIDSYFFIGDEFVLVVKGSRYFDLNNIFPSDCGAKTGNFYGALGFCLFGGSNDNRSLVQINSSPRIDSAVPHDQFYTVTYPKFDGIRLGDHDIGRARNHRQNDNEQETGEKKEF